MANRFPYGPTQMPAGMGPPSSGGVPAAPVSLGAGQQYGHAAPQQYFHAMHMTTPSMVQVNVPNEMQQGIFQMTVHPAMAHSYGLPVTPGYGQQKSPMTEEQRRWLGQQQIQAKERLLRERDFQKQQQRLREFSVGAAQGGQQKLEADNLIRSMFGAATEDPKRKNQRPAGQYVKPAPPVVIEHSVRQSGAASGFQASQKARDWSNLDDLHNVFSSPNKSDFPAWCQAGAPIPPIYTQVENYVTRNGVIDTSLLYPVLVSSGLSRETLGQIWTLANRHTPGLLDQSELYATLAFVALAQNACQITSVDTLHALHQAPVPLLNQVVPAPPPVAHSTPDQVELVQPIANAVVADNDDFDDFKSAAQAPSPSVIPSASSSVGSRLAHHTLTHSPGVINHSEAPSSCVEADSMDDFSDFQKVQLTTTTPPRYVNSSPHQTDSPPFNIPERVLRDQQRTHCEPDRIPALLETALVTDVKCVDFQMASVGAELHSQFGTVGFGEQNVISRGDLLGAAAAEDRYSVFRDLEAAAEPPPALNVSSVAAVFDEDDFGDFLSGTAAQSRAPPSIPATPFGPSTIANMSSNSNPDLRAFHSKPDILGVEILTTPFDPSPFTNLSSNLSTASDLGAFHGNSEPSDIEFTDFQSASIPAEAPISKPSAASGSSLSSLISDMHGFHASSMVDEEFGDFMAPSGCQDSKEMDQLTIKSTPSFESQSVSSLDFVTGEFATGGESEPPLGRHGSIPSLHLRVAESPEQEAEGTVGSATTESVEKNGVSDPRQPLAPMMTSAGGQSLVDRYSLMRLDAPRHTDARSYEWQRCLDKCQQVISEAFKIFNGVSNSKVSNEVIGSEEGENYLKNIIEIYRISCRISASAKTSRGTDPKIGDTIGNIEVEWNKLMSFVMSSPVIPDEDGFDFSASALDLQEKSLKRACGVCLLDVDASCKSRSRGGSDDSECFKLTYGGRQYHSACANFWVNFVDSLLPSLAFEHNLL